MLNKVLETIKKYNMISAGDSVTVALSGGADSVALLLALKKLQKELGISIDACHVNHNLRGEEAKRDENFCIDLCRRLEIPLNVASVDVLERCKSKKLSTEMAARELRYEALNEFSKGKIATAHTLSDCLETSLFNFTRGTGLKGLCGIVPLRDNIIRPLINVKRSEIEEFLKAENQSFVNDSTNFENIYSRNKIRNIVIPCLNEINQSFSSTYEKNRETLLDEEEFLNFTSEKALHNALNSDGSLDCEKLSKEHSAIRKRVIFNYFSQRKASCDFKKVKLIDDMLTSGGEVEIKENIYARIRQGKLSLSERAENRAESKNVEITAKEEKIINFGRKTIVITPLQEEEKKFFVNSGKKAFKNYVDCDKLKSSVCLRTRLPKDTVELYGRNVRKSVKKLFNENKLLIDDRDTRVIFECAGEIIFIEGFGVSCCVSVDEKTENAVKINIK